MAVQNKPAWLDVAFLQKILRNFENDESVVIVGVTGNSATVDGDNYMSNLERIFVEYLRVRDGREVREKKSFIAKIIPQTVWFEKLTSVSDHFGTESSMMMNTLPKMNQALASLRISPLSAHCFYVQTEKPAHLLIEDLSSKGFRMADRRRGLDLDHCLLAMRRLALFHASSVALKEKDPRIVTSYKKGLFYKHHPLWLIKHFNTDAKALAKETAKWPELNPRISEKIYNLSDTAYAKAAGAVQYRDDDFNVLNHGDYWTNNMLFRYEEREKPIDHAFVDFQLSVHGSPAIDLLFFLGTSPSDDVRWNNRELLIREYHDSLRITMTKLKCTTEVPALDKLLRIVKERAFFEVVVTFSMLSTVLTEQNETKSLEDLIEPNEEHYNSRYRQELYRKVMARILPLYDSMGLLDA